MNWLYGISYLVGICLWLSPLYAQSSLKDLQQIQLLSQDECIIVQVNADWNFKASLDLNGLNNCVWFNASIDNKEYGAIITDEWKIVSVPTIILIIALTTNITPMETMANTTGTLFCVR